MDFSLFYFADGGLSTAEAYRLLIEGARFADRHGFTAVWTPERHFHQFGGSYPNPAVTAGALSAITERIGIRAGSVVAPLHHPLRIAEDWAVVDNLSGGRAGLSLASGWHPHDFVFRPEAYADRRDLTIQVIDTLRGLWHGEPYSGDDVPGDAVLRVHPRPVQDPIPLWLTSGGATDTFEAAGKSGVGVLTHLMSQSVDELAGKVAAYRTAYAASGRPGRGHVVLMLHTYLDHDLDAAHQVVSEPLQRYLVSALDLSRNSGGRGAAARPAPTPAAARLGVRAAYERYLHRDGLFGSVGHARDIVERVAGADVDEIAALVDFGVPVDAALIGLRPLAQLREACR
ncbi:MupA/Atu3671 family FMN-dependent luciferase-like monooxygenase [Micromonospora sp. HUAS YX12]|uniref:MupA/Atu3671 family FMN-dependent luciferase-like monooxygenase n=1 Tax=Micromonospora sp. HUAS YX12 TaxID=3156396 RepID=A0AAU7R4Y6_9ACTN